LWDGDKGGTNVFGGKGREGNVVNGDGTGREGKETEKGG